MHRKPTIYWLSRGILSPGVQNPQNAVGQKSKIFDFAQNDFGGISDNFPKFFSPNFPQKTHRKEIFELPLRMIGLLMGISMVAIFSPIWSKMAEWRPFWFPKLHKLVHSSKTMLSVHLVMQTKIRLGRNMHHMTPTSFKSDWRWPIGGHFCVNWFCFPHRNYE